VISDCGFRIADSIQSAIGDPKSAIGTREENAMAPTIKQPAPSTATNKPIVLVVDDEPALVDLARDIVGRGVDCRVLSAGSLRQARDVLRSQKIDLLLLDVNLPDGDGMSLLPLLRERHPTAEAVVVTGQPSLDGAIGAMRAGVIDFLPKPFTAEHLQERVRRALARQAIVARTDKRLRRLRRAVRGLNVSRRTVSQKVDLLCNDLVSAYGELSKQLDAVRVQESFRKLCYSARDLEQLLCHAMDYILRQAGYSNVAVWLAAEEGVSELGAYMKYTIPGDRALTEAMKEGLVPLITRDGFIHLQPEDLAQQLTAVECEHLSTQTILGANCTYLGETLATLVVFRDARSPFTEEDGMMLRAITPIFATALASIVRKQGDALDDGENEVDENSPFYDDSATNDSDTVDEDEAPPRNERERERERERRERREKEERERKERHAADWWKRGEPPPF
jgi:FixJ family two-component response regulator